MNEQRSFRSSPSIGQLAAALAKAQSKMQGAKKDSSNPFFKSKYADLESVVEAVRGPLTDNGLAFLQFPRSTEAGVEVETMLAHESGEWVSESLSVPVSKHDAQGVGSAITYGRRYGLQSICGVAPEEDDGHAAAASMAGLKAAALGKLKAAASKGSEDLEKTWKALTVEERKACQSDLAGLKQKALEVSGVAS